MNEKLLDQVLQSPRLPSLPTIALEVIELVQQKDVNIREIAHTIQHDPALASKILKTVNSSFYGQAHAVSTVSHALVVLGLNSVKTLALGFSLVNNLKGPGQDGFDHVTFWKRSLYTATTAKRLSAEVGLVQQEEAFLGGLLQDLGQLALAQVLGQTYTRLLRQAEQENRCLVELERAELGTDHPEIGAALAESWKLPPLLVAPIRYHEAPDQAEAETASLVQCVALGNEVAGIFIHDEPAEAMEAYQRKALNWFGLAPERSEPLLREIHTHSNEMRRLFDLPTGELGNPDEILARANEALMQISLQTQQQSSELEQQNRELTEKVNIDSLTGVANRGRLSEFISEQFDISQRQNTDLSVLFLDTDHFKDFNDTYGHPTGDRVLIELAALLEREVPTDAMVARYGGEEFAVVLPGMARKAAARLAEDIRRKVTEMTVESEAGQLLNVSASIGVATHAERCFTRAQQLLKAADQGVYAAKNAGRNCVRVFAPRKQAPAA